MRPHKRLLPSVPPTDIVPSQYTALKLLPTHNSLALTLVWPPQIRFQRSLSIAVISRLIAYFCSTSSSLALYAFLSASTILL